MCASVYVCTEADTAIFILYLYSFPDKPPADEKQINRQTKLSKKENTSRVPVGNICTSPVQTRVEQSNIYLPTAMATVPVLPITFRVSFEGEKNGKERS